jgi:hypothetical protein
VVLDLHKKGKEGEDEVEQLRKLHQRVKFEQSSGGPKKEMEENQDGVCTKDAQDGKGKVEIRTNGATVS